MDADAFLSSSVSFAGSALSARAREDTAVACLHAGVSFEHLCKGVLWQRSPALVANNDYDSLLHVVGLQDAAHRGPRTVGAAVALERVQRFYPAVCAHKQGLGLLIDFRNGVAHAADAAVNDLSAVWMAWSEASEVLASAAGIPAGVFRVGPATVRPPSTDRADATVRGVDPRAAASGSAGADRQRLGADAVRDLEAFVAVASSLTFTEAARRLKLDQSTLTRRLASLERLLERALLARDPRGVALTADGEAFLPAAQRVLEAVRLADAAGERLRTGGPPRREPQQR